MTRAKKPGPDVKQLILVPAVISFAVTILRLVGELNDWSPHLFSRKAGGGGALVGISWLIPIFGIYFAVKLVRNGFTPRGNARVLVFAVAGAVAAVAVFAAGGSAAPGSILSVIVYVISAAIGILLQRIAWPELFRALVAYAFAVRIPVAIVMLVAIFGEWGTHYDVTSIETFAEMSPLARWLFIGALPQFTAWIMVTVVVGIFFGGIAAMVMRAKAPEEVAHPS